MLCASGRRKIKKISEWDARIGRVIGLSVGCAEDGEAVEEILLMLEFASSVCGSV